jgi:hypothetical protein
MRGEQPKVVDLAAYRAAREQKPLPLFDGPQGGTMAAPAPGVALSARQVEHRARMLRYMGGRGLER